MHRLSLLVGRGLPFSVVQDLSSPWLLLLWSARSRHMGLWPTGLTTLRHVESSHFQDSAHVPHIGRHFPTTGPPGKSSCKLFSPLTLFIFRLRTTTILLVSAIHQHGSAIAILTSTPLWKSCNSGILCSWSCPCRSGHNVPLSPWQDKRFCLFCHFLSHEWESVIPFKFRALRIV